MRNLVARNLIAFTLLAYARIAHATNPTPSPARSWENLQSLPADVSINVKALKRHASCKLKSVDAETLTCTNGKDVVFQRAEIKSVIIPRRGRYTLIALGIGAGGGAIAVAAGTGCSSQERNSAFGCFLTPTRSQGAAIGAVLFGAIASPIGYFTDFAASTIYRAP